MLPNLPPNAEELFQQYIADKKILVADSSSGVRSGIAKVLKELGAKTSNIAFANSYEAAALEIKRVQPYVIIADYHLEDQCGLKLIHLQRDENRGAKDTLFIVVTANSAESSIAEAAEEEVDSYILKPFTTTVAREYILKSAIAKLLPSDYRKVINDGKTMLAAKEFDRAASRFIDAVKMADKPTLAYFYHGQACLGMNDLDRAESSFQSGLKFNEFHYRCLTGLFDLLIVRKRNVEAYEVAKKLSSVFPLSPPKLDAILRLAVKNEIFDDIEHYYRAYSEMDYRTPELTKCMIAGLVVGGLYQLSHDRKDRAVDLFGKAMITSARMPAVLREVIMALVKKGQFRIADEFLKEFPPVDGIPDANYRTMEFLVLNGLGTLPDVIGRGRRLIKDGIYDVLVYEILIARTVEAKMMRSAEAIAYDAVTRWPKYKEKFLKMIEGS